MVAESLGLSSENVSGSAVVLRSEGMRVSVTISRVKRESPLLSWTVFIEDEDFLPEMQKYGGVGVEIWRPDRVQEGDLESLHNRYLYPWPKNRASLGSALLEDLGEFGRPALRFVRDKKDLGRLLMAVEDVHRGKVWARLSSGDEPSRLVKAFLIARKSRYKDVEREAWAKLREVGERDISWEPDTPFLFRQSLADWARQYAKKTDVPLEDLVRLKRHRVGT